VPEATRCDRAGPQRLHPILAPALPAQRHPGTRPPSSSSRACSRGASGSCWVSAGCRGSRARAVASASPRLVRRRRSRPRLGLALRIPV